MNLLEHLSSALGRRDEQANLELAAELLKSEDREAVALIMTTLQESKDKRLQNDCIKVLYEVGEKKPYLISGHYAVFLELLNSKNNSLVWGAMTAIDYLCVELGDQMFRDLPFILEAAQKGSVIAKDHAFAILIQVYDKESQVFPLILEFLQGSAFNQFPMYAERFHARLKAKEQARFIELLAYRIKELPKESQRKRIEKILKRLN